MNGIVGAFIIGAIVGLICIYLGVPLYLAIVMGGIAPVFYSIVFDEKEKENE